MKQRAKIVQSRVEERPYWQRVDIKNQSRLRLFALGVCGLAGLILLDPLIQFDASSSGYVPEQSTGVATGFQPFNTG